MEIYLSHSLYCLHGVRTQDKVKVKMSLCLIKHYAMKMYRGVEVWFHVFLASALFGGEWSSSRPGRFTHGEGCVGPRTGLEKKSCPYRDLKPDPSAVKPVARDNF
jgi:hypothetical protein